MFGQDAISDSQDIDGNPVHRASHSRESSMDDYKVAVGDDHARLVLERRGRTLDEVKETIVTRFDWALCWM